VSSLLANGFVVSFTSVVVPATLPLTLAVCHSKRTERRHVSCGHHGNNSKCSLIPLRLAHQHYQQPASESGRTLSSDWLGGLVPLALPRPAFTFKAQRSPPSARPNTTTIATTMPTMAPAESAAELESVVLTSSVRERQRKRRIHRQYYCIWRLQSAAGCQCRVLSSQDVCYHNARVAASEATGHAGYAYPQRW
jgi:hypothetical protein